MSGVEWNILEIPIYARLIGKHSRFQNSEIRNEKMKKILLKGRQEHSVESGSSRYRN